MKKLFFTLTLAVSLIGCNNNVQTPVTAFEELPANSITMDSVFEDTTKVINVSTPVLLDSAAQILLHEVYLSDLNNSKDSYNMSKKVVYGEVDELINLIFEQVNNNTSNLLTNQRVRIYSKEIIKSSNKNLYAKYILYRLIDADYNRDGKLNGNDIESIYISRLDGTSFEKITKDNEDFHDGEWIGYINRYYFRTYKDLNKNGYFDKNDKVYNYYIQFSNDGYNVVEYQPLDILANK